MVIYTEADKELVIPTGLGNLNSSSGSCEGVYEAGWRDGYISGATSTSGTAYQQGYSHGWQDGVSEGFRRVSEQSIELSFSGNGSWEKPFFDDIYARKVVVDVKQQAFFSFNLHFTDTIPITAEDIVSVGYLKLGGGARVFYTDKIFVTNNNIMFSGLPETDEGMSRLTITIPHEKYAEWSSIVVNEMYINGNLTDEGQWSNGIRLYWNFQINHFASGDDEIILIGLF